MNIFLLFEFFVYEIFKILNNSFFSFTYVLINLIYKIIFISIKCINYTTYFLATIV